MGFYNTEMSSLVDKFQTVQKRCAKWKTLWMELTPRKHFLERLERFCPKLGEVTVLYFYTFQSMSTQTWKFGGKELEAGQKRRSPRILRDAENLWGLSGPCHQGAHAGNIQGGAPPVISWFIIPSNYRYDPLITPSYWAYKPT